MKFVVYMPKIVTPDDANILLHGRWVMKLELPVLSRFVGVEPIPTLPDIMQSSVSGPPGFGVLQYEPKQVNAAEKPPGRMHYVTTALPGREIPESYDALGLVRVMGTPQIGIVTTSQYAQNRVDDHINEGLVHIFEAHVYAPPSILGLRSDVPIQAP